MYADNDACPAINCNKYSMHFEQFNVPHNYANIDVDVSSLVAQLQTNSDGPAGIFCLRFDATLF
jgi:hypothetical protein